MDSENKPKLSVKYRREVESADQNKCDALSRKGVFVQLEGTHTSSTSTDQLDLSEEQACTSKKVPSLVFHPSEPEVRKVLQVQGNKKVEKTKKPVEEMIQEMNDNIQTIMDMFGHKGIKNEIEEGRLTSSPLRQVTFQKNSKTKTTTIESPNQSELNKFLDAKKQHINGPGEHFQNSTELSRISFITEQNKNGSILSSIRTEAGISHDSDLVDSNQKLLMYQSSRVANFSGKESSSNSMNVNGIRDQKKSDTSDIQKAKLFSIKPDEVIVPICEGISEGNMSLVPCENVYHTLHIEAASSPTSSVMYRPPICSRLWSVITDFITAICLCLQVNRDCIFCLAFFVAFVVSASFLTAFFYRTLSVDPQALRQIQQTQQRQDILRNDNIKIGTQRRGYR